MSTKMLSLLAAVIILGAGIYYVSNRGGAAPLAGNDDAGTTPVSGMRAEENMVVVSEQRPGTTITGSLVYLAAPGYLVIHEDKNGEPGAVLGASALLQAGESSNVQVKISRTSRDGERLHAMLHFEKGVDTSFVAAEDTPVPSRLGGSISGWFDISAEAGENVPITI